MYTDSINLLSSLPLQYKQEIVRKLSDYVLLNAFSVESSSLYHGKAGMSLALFTAGRYLDDEYLEEQAADLLEEALLSKISDISFENGLAGIGYTLVHLIKSDYIDADFQDVFEEPFNRIIADCEKFKDDLYNRKHQLRINLFFAKVQEISYRTLDSVNIMEHLFGEVENTLLSHLQWFTDICSTIRKRDVIGLLKEYLKIVSLCKFESFSTEVIDVYAKLYSRGFIASDYELGYYLDKIDKQCQYQQVALLNKKYSPRYERNSSLREKLDVLQVVDNPSATFHGEIAVLLQKLEAEMSAFIPHHAASAGYGDGVSRLICYLAHPEIILL